MSSQVAVARFEFVDIEEIISDVPYDDAFDSCGNKWFIEIHQGSDHRRTEVNEAIHFSFYRGPRWRGGKDGDALNCKYNISAKVEFVVRNKMREVAHEFEIPMHTYKYHVECDESGMPIILNDTVGFKGNNFGVSWPELREKDVLVEGSLVIDAIIHVTHEENEHHIPPNPFGRSMLNLRESEEFADVFFQVGNEQFGAHRLILQVNASVLANFCDGSHNQIIQITDTDPRVFDHILQFIYGGNTPDDAEILRYGKEILDACNLYGVVGLKIAAESALVRHCSINVDNAADWLQYADAKTCPLLKEYAMNYIIARVKDVMKSESYKNLKESPRLMEELMLALQSNLDVDERFGSKEGTLSINNLRGKLNKRGLDMDGSREMLVKRLKKKSSS